MKQLRSLLTMSLLALTIGQADATETPKPIDIVVYRSSSCECCGRWLEHLQQNNFKIKEIVTDNVQEIKDKYGITEPLASCHTGIVEGYVVEGHVPANDIMKLLQTKPKVACLTVPGMPRGTPGMEMGGKKDPYQVISFDAQKNVAVFNSYE